MSADGDILIVGGGPVGAALGLGLAGSGRTVVLMEARAQKEITDDVRTLALSYGSRLILQRLGVWDKLEGCATPISTIHVSCKGHWGRSILHAEDMRQPALGYVLPYGVLCSVLIKALEAAPGVQVLYGAKVSAVTSDRNHACAEFEQAGQAQIMTAALLVLAEGGQILEGIPNMRRHVREYWQGAVVARVEAEQPHHHVAYERFTSDGPVALLPDGKHGFALVWTSASETARVLCNLDEQEFLDRLGRHFGDRVGRFVSVTERAVFPLKFSRTSPVTTHRMAVIGNAAQTLHPVAGQGFNLGLRDAWALARLVRNTPHQCLGDEEMTAKYCRQRQVDRLGSIGITDFLATAFSCQLSGVGTALGMGVAAVEMLTPARKFLARRMSFGMPE